MVKINEKILHLELLENASFDFQALSELYVMKSQIFMVVFAINDKHSFKEAQENYKFILKHLDKEPSTLILVGNKSDLDHSREVSQKEAQDYAESIGHFYVETSAMKMINIESSFEQLCKAYLKSFITKEYFQSLEKENEKKKDGCLQM